jgi:hypothetical protein
MSNDTEVLRQCMEAVAEADVDISPAVYTAVSASMPEANQHMADMDDRMKGRMLDQVYQLLLGETDDEYLQFEARMHRGYGANGALYQGLLTAVKDAVRATLGPNWVAEHEAAWDRSIKKIVDEFGKAEFAEERV